MEINREKKQRENLQLSEKEKVCKRAKKRKSEIKYRLILHYTDDDKRVRMEKGEWIPQRKEKD